MAAWVQGATAVALTYPASETFAETLASGPPQSLRSGNFVPVSPGCSLSSLQPPTRFLPPPRGQPELGAALASPGDQLPPRGNGPGTSARTPQQSHPPASEPGMPPDHPGAERGSLPACRGRAHPPTRSGGGRRGAAAAGMAVAGGGSRRRGTPRHSRPGGRPAALRRARPRAAGERRGAARRSPSRRRGVRQRTRLRTGLCSSGEAL